MNKLILSSALVLSALASNQALAGTANETFQANASVDRSCRIETTTTGGVFLLNAFDTAEQNNVGLNDTRVDVSCSLYSTLAEAQQHPVIIRYSEGLHANAGSSCDIPLRRMKSTTSDNYISYRLIPSLPSLRNKEFGCGTNYIDSASPAAPNGFVERAVQSANPVPNTPISSRTATTRIAPGQNMFNETYNDTITVSIEF